MPDCILHEFRRRGHVEHRHDMLLVLFRGSRRDMECRSHLLGRTAFGKELKDFSLAKSQHRKVCLALHITLGGHLRQTFGQGGVT